MSPAASEPTHDQLDALERAGRPLQRVRLRGEILATRSPVELSYTEVLASMRDTRSFVYFVLPQPGEDGVETWPRMARWQVERLQAEWVARHDLGTYEGARRLAFLLNRYREAIEYDLHPGASVNDLWRARQWRLLLNLIDRLPRASHYQEAVVGDEEHVRMLVEASERSGQKPPTGPRMSDWTPDHEVLVGILDAVRALTVTTVRMNLPKGKPGPKFEPSERPRTAFDKIRHQVKQARHDALADRVLRRGAYAQKD